MKMYIDGAAAAASNGEVIEVLNPATSLSTPCHPPRRRT